MVQSVADGSVTYSNAKMPSHTTTAPIENVYAWIKRHGATLNA